MRFAGFAGLPIAVGLVACASPTASGGTSGAAPDAGAGNGAGRTSTTSGGAGGASSVAGGDNGTGGNGGRGGSTGSGGAAGTAGTHSEAGNGNGGTSGNGTGGSAGSAPLGCPDTQAAGTWQNVTPAGLDLAGSWGGMHVLLADPVRRNELYVTCDTRGTYRSTDCGLTWKKVNTGRNGAKLDVGRQWSGAIDPNPNRDPSTFPAIYEELGYGSLGLWKSTNGGVDWDNVWNNNIYASNGTTNISSDVGSDLSGLSVISRNSLDHMILYLHSYWGTGNYNGLFETKNGGGTWIDHTSATFGFQPHADEAFGLDDTTWIVSHGITWPHTEIWRTTDAGTTWNIVAHDIWLSGGLWAGNTYYSPHGPGANGTVTDGFHKTTDLGATWTHVTLGGPAYTLFRDGSVLYAVKAQNWWDQNWAILTSSVTNDTAWTPFPRPPVASMDCGPGNNASINSCVPAWSTVIHDGARTVLVTSNFKAGVWRYVAP